ncbi:MAG: hypothetical protein J5534_12825 [Fibrobacter sp.]|nr:hypothetical protein [Fibrobacter sp.]
MKLSLFRNLFALIVAVGVFASYANAAPAQKSGSKNSAALVDEATPAAQAEPATAQKAGAEEPANNKTAASAQNPSACEHAAPQKKSDIPIFPIVVSSIGTIAFIVLAIIF